MRDDIAPTALDARRDVSVLLYRGATFADLITGPPAEDLNLTQYVSRAAQTERDLRLELVWHDQLDGTDQPRPGDLVRVELDGVALWHGMVESISEYRLESYARSMELTLRPRDTAPLWRTLRWTSDVYPVGTDLSAIAVDVLTALGVGSAERALLPSGIRTVHAASQLADLTAWEMLTTLLFASRRSPWVDALGRFKAVSRDVSRDADQQIELDRVQRIRGSRSKPGVTGYRLKWLDPMLTKSKQQAQVLGSEQITAGFFKLKQERDVFWSSDRRQRADNTYMRTLQSANSGLLPFCDEEYSQQDEYHGRITVTTSIWAPTLVLDSIIAIQTAHKMPDYSVPSGGPTIPVGRIVEGAAHIELLLVLMSLGVGSYEIWGEPFDYVHAVNTTEAYDDAAPAHSRSEVEEQNDYITSEEHAQEVAVSELLYRSYEAQSWGVDIVDDPRVEVGDILALPDGARLYVTGYSRDLTHGAPAILAVNGFRV